MKRSTTSSPGWLACSLLLSVSCILLTTTLDYGSSPILIVSGQSFSLNLIYSEAIQGRVFPLTNKGVECGTSTAANVTGTGTACYGGAARRATYIALQRSLSNGTLVVDIGNTFYGTSYPTIATPQGSNIGRWMSESTYDVVGMGSHDFFNGPDNANSYWNSLTPGSPAIVCANLVTVNETRITAPILPYTTKMVNGRKIGIIGAIDPGFIATSTPGLAYATDPVTSIKAAYTSLVAANPDCNIVILITSLAVSDIRLVISGVAGIDIVLYHYTTDDTTLINYSRLPGKTAGSSVLVATVPNVGGFSIFGMTMGQLVCNFDSSGVLTTFTGALTVMDKTYAPQPTIWSEVLADAAKVAAYNGLVVAQLTDPYGGSQSDGVHPVVCQTTDCNVGRLFADSMLYWCKDCNIAHTNAGGIRGDLLLQSLSTPNVTRSQINTVVGFSDTFAWYTILGKDFYASILQFLVTTRWKASGWNQFSGVRFAFNPNSGSIIVVYIQNRATGAWEQLNPAKTYKVVTNSFVATAINAVPNGGRTATEPKIGPILSQNAFGPTTAEGLISWIQSPAFVPPPTMAELVACNDTYTLSDTTGTGDYSWPLSQCTQIRTTKTTNLADQCPTNTAQCLAGNTSLAYDGKYYNQSMCDSCSGLGTCISGYRRCSCDPPTTTGLFAGIVMVEGTDCSIIREEFTTSDIVNGIMYAFTIITCILIVCVSIFFFIYRSSKVVKRAAPTFLQLSCFGSLLGAIGAFTIIAPTSDATCQASTWLCNMGFVILFGSLFIKTWRIKHIFGNSRLQTVVLTDFNMLMRLGVFIALELILRLSELGASNVRMTAKELDSGSSSTTFSLQSLLDGTAVVDYSNFKYYLTCSSPHYMAINTVNFVYKGVITLWGCILAYGIKDIPEDFNESRLLALVIYNMAVLGSIAKIMVEFIGHSYPSITLVIEVMAINIIICVTLFALSYPKYVIIQKGGGNGLGQVVTKAGGTKTHEDSTPGVSRAVITEFTGTTAGGPITPAAFMETCTHLLEKLQQSTGRDGDEGSSETKSQLDEFVNFLQHAQKFGEQQVTTLRKAVTFNKVGDSSGIIGGPTPQTPNNKNKTALQRQPSMGDGLGSGGPPGSRTPIQRPFGTQNAPKTPTLNSLVQSTSEDQPFVPRINSLVQPQGSSSTPISHDQPMQSPISDIPGSTLEFLPLDENSAASPLTVHGHVELAQMESNANTGRAPANGCREGGEGGNGGDVDESPTAIVVEQ